MLCNRHFEEWGAENKPSCSDFFFFFLKRVIHFLLFFVLVHLMLYLSGKSCNSGLYLASHLESVRLESRARQKLLRPPILHLFFFFFFVFCIVTHESPRWPWISDNPGATLISSQYPNIPFNSNRHAGAHKLEPSAGQDVWFPIRPYPEQ